MDEAELDEWFNESRRKIEEKFYSAVMENLKTEDWTEEKQRFDAEYAKLIKGYHTKHRRLLEWHTQKRRMVRPLHRVRLWRASKARQIQKLIRKTETHVRKWLFEQKIKRILRQRNSY